VVLADWGVAETPGPKSMLATVVGYALVAVVAYVALKMFVGTIFWLFRSVIVVAIIGGLLLLYLNLKAPDDPG
jgi:uncharacterized membrane protein YdjX (TVP38/TMEM64 family)